MKKIFVFLLIISVLCFNMNIIDVKAENETGTTTETGSTETGTTEGGETGGEGTGTGTEKEKEEETEKDNSKSDATIKNLTINGNLKILCNEKFICEKDIIDTDVKSVKVTYELSNKSATVEPKEFKSGFTKELKDGENKFEIKVTSEDKSKTNTYVIKINKKNLSTDSTLKKIAVNGTEVTLKEDTTKYTASVSFGTKKLEIEAVPTDEKATIVDFKNNKASFDFFENSKDIKIKVQSEAGDMTTYTLTVTKRGEADVTLKSLKIKGYEIEFDKEVTDYELKVLKNVDKLDIEAKATDSKADIKITNPKLSVGENEVKIEVSNDGNTNTYLIKVTKLNEDDKTLANLKSLTIDNYEIDFKPDKYEYDLKIENENYLVIKAKAKLSDANVEITGNLDLEDGSIIKIKVTYDDEFSNVYKINIAKAGGSFTSKNKVSKKAVIAGIIFDIISIITIGIVQFVNKNKKNDKIDKNEKNDDTNEEQEIVKKEKKTKKVIETVDDIDII